jgi:hypothetical protein
LFDLACFVSEFSATYYILLILIIFLLKKIVLVSTSINFTLVVEKKVADIFLKKRKNSFIDKSTMQDVPNEL